MLCKVSAWIRVHLGMEALGKVLESQTGSPMGCQSVPTKVMGRMCLIKIPTNQLMFLSEKLCQTWQSGFLLAALDWGSRMEGSASLLLVPLQRANCQQLVRHNGGELGTSSVSISPISLPPWQCGTPPQAPGLRQAGNDFVLRPCFLLWARGWC